MKILFLPSDLGGGFGHISRCLALADEAKNRGHNCTFILNDQKYKKRIGKSFNVFVCKINHHISFLQKLKLKLFRKKLSDNPLFIEISSLDYQVLRDGFTDKKVIVELLNEYIKIAEHHRPDVLIGDTNLLVWMLSNKIKVPAVQIVRFASHPASAKLIWWKDVSHKMIQPDIAEVFNPVLNKIGLESIKRAEDLLKGHLYIVPSLPEIEPVLEDEKSVHVGSLTLTANNSEPPIWFKEINDKDPLVYITIGGGAGSVGNKLFFETVIQAFSNKNIQVIVSTTNKFDPDKFSNLPSNIRMYKWVPGKFIISKSDLIIFHGGYGTMMEAISCGKPTIVIPFHTEQEGNGRRLEELGCGTVIKLSNETYIKVESKWQYGRFTYLIQNKYDIKPEMLYKKCLELLNDEKYLNAAKILQAKINEYQGSQKTIDLIEKKWS